MIPWDGTPIIMQTARFDVRKIGFSMAAIQKNEHCSGGITTAAVAIKVVDRYNTINDTMGPAMSNQYLEKQDDSDSNKSTTSIPMFKDGLKPVCHAEWNMRRQTVQR